ncbi:MAG: hypothetical protein ACTHLR_15490 [Rhizomicrobium sp.]
MTIFYIGLVTVFLVAIYMSRMSAGQVANYLEFHYHAEWERLGRPGFLTNGLSLQSNFVSPWLMLGFLFTRSYRKFLDAELNKIGNKALALQVVAIVLILLLASFLFFIGKPHGV